MSRRVTIGTIAAEIGLSKFAVSRALAGKSGVSDATRARVAEAAASAGYRKSVAVSARTIGVIFDETDLANGELQVQIQNGVRRETERLGIEVRFHWVRDAAGLEPHASAREGLLVVGPAAARGMGHVYKTGVPVVRIGWASPLEQVDTITSTNQEGGAAAIDHLAGLGHRVIAFAHGVPGYRGRSERFQGAREAAELSPSVQLHDLSWTETDNFVGALARLREAGHRPTAFFCANDGLAVTVISELLAQGLRIPEDASVIGFGDFVAARQISPQLTTLRTRGVAMGEVAVRLLHQRMTAEDAATPPVRIRVVSELIVRGSTGPAPSTARG